MHTKYHFYKNFILIIKLRKVLQFDFPDEADAKDSYTEETETVTNTEDTVKDDHLVQVGDNPLLHDEEDEVTIGQDNQHTGHQGQELCEHTNFSRENMLNYIKF